MEISTIHEILFEAISKASKITIKNPQIPVLEYVLLELLDASTLRVTANNLDILYIQDIFVKTLSSEFKKQSVCVAGGLVLSYLSLFNKNDQIHLTISEKGLILNINGQKSTINGVSSTDYPKNNVEEGVQDGENTGKIIIDSDVLIKGVQSVSFAAAITSIKPELSCIMMSIVNQEMIFVATDGFRLAEKRCSLPKEVNSPLQGNTSNLDDFKQVLVPARIFQDCLKIIPNEVELRLSIKKGALHINMAESLISLRIISGSYPNYQAILPKEFITTIEIGSDDFLNGLKASNIFSDEFNYVKLDVEGETLLLNSKNSKLGESVFKKNTKKTGENISQSYNHRYLSDFIGKIKDEVVILNISGKSTPSILKIKGDQNYTYLVMPMNK
jgi:DNA polymerase-3 subunit beta